MIYLTRCWQPQLWAADFMLFLLFINAQIFISICLLCFNGKPQKSWLKCTKFTLYYSLGKILQRMVKQVGREKKIYIFLHLHFLHKHIILHFKCIYNGVPGKHNKMSSFPLPPNKLYISQFKLHLYRHSSLLASSFVIFQSSITILGIIMRFFCAFAHLYELII